MRLKRLSLRNYGCFAALDLGLATEPGRITLVTAPNGAGKSVLRQAFHDLLFDIPLQSPMKFRHGYTGMALHAEAELADGAPFSFGWERGSKPQRVTSDPARFAALRDGVTPQQLESLFALDTLRLRKGGTDLKGGATLSEALLAGTGELASAKAVRAVIEERRNQNWSKGKSKPPLNAATGRLEETRKQLRDAIVSPEARERAEAAMAEWERILTEARAARHTATAETRRLNRIGLTRPHLQALDAAETWLAANPDAPALPPDREGALAAAREQAVLAQARHEEADLALQRATAALDTIARDTACTALADRLAALPGLLGETSKASKDLAALRLEHAAKMGSIRSGLRAIGSDLPEESAATVVPTVGLKADVQAAITGEATLRTALDLARTGVSKATAALAKASSEPPVAAPLPDGLVALLGEIRADRNPVTHAEETQADLTGKAAEVRRLLALVPGWRGTADALREAAVPPDAEFERLNTEHATATGEAEAARTRRADLEAQDTRAKATLAEMHARALPDTASVQSARAERDRGMALVLARAFGEPPLPADEAAFAGTEPMPVAYRRRVREADALADRRAEELEQVHEAERLARMIEDAVEPLRQAAAVEAMAEESLTAAGRAWADAVAGLRLGPLTTIGGLRQACDARRLVVDALARLETAQAAQAALAARHLAWAGRLSACMGVPSATLGALLAEADQRVATARQAEQAVTKRQTMLEAARRALPEAQETFDAADAAMTRWQTAWGELLQRLGRPADESTAAVTAMLEQVAGLEKHHRDAEALAGRIGGIVADLARFAETVSALALEVGHLDGTPPLATNASETARALIERAGAASRMEAAWHQAEQASHAAAEAEAEADLALRDVLAKLDAVVASCGAKDADAAEARIAASRAHVDQTRLRDAARAKLIEHGDGLDTDALRAEAEAVTVDAMIARRQAAEDQATAAQERAEEAAVALNTIRTELNVAAASTAATEARAEHEAAIARFERLLEDQLVLHLASTMLGDAMREVKDTTGGSALAQTSAAFAAVTDGAYSLKVVDSPTGEALFATELAYPEELKALTELSEGTRDQLYLALRMEALRGHCQSAMAVPFIADDILQTFDDGRAAAALRALCALSVDLQVIVLTHHPHLRAIATGLGPGLVRLVEL